MSISGIRSQPPCFSPGAMAEMRQRMFKKMDVNTDGILDKTELTDVAKKTGKHMADLVTQFDTNGDGGLNIDEMDTLTQTMRPQGPPPVMPGMNSNGSANADASLLKMLDGDTNANGKVTQIKDLIAQFIKKQTGGSTGYDIASTLSTPVT